MKRIITLFTLLTALLVWAPDTYAQTWVTQATLDASVDADDTVVNLSASTDVTVGNYVFIDQEKMRILAVNANDATEATVFRGDSAGGPAMAHASGARVWIGNGVEFSQNRVSGTCVFANQQYLPHINTQDGIISDCEGGTWMARRTDPVYVRENTVRDSFDGAFFVHQDDMSAKSVTDDEDNVVQGSPLGAIEYREELTKTASSWVTTASLLDISADDTTNDEGVEILFGSIETGVWALAGTQGGCIAASVTIDDISGTDQVQVGVRDNAAFPDAAAYAGLTVWNSIGVNATDGSIVSSQEVSEATDTDDSGVNWADGETRGLKVCISKAGVPTAFYSDAYTHSQVLTDWPAWNAVTMTETGSTLTAATAMTPFFSYLAAGTDGADVAINWVELTRIP